MDQFLKLVPGDKTKSDVFKGKHFNKVKHYAKSRTIGRLSSRGKPLCQP